MKTLHLKFIVFFTVSTLVLTTSCDNNSSINVLSTSNTPSPSPSKPTPTNSPTVVPTQSNQPEQTPTPQPTNRKPASYKYVLITEDCAPWDGAAIKIYLSEKPLDCKNLEPPNLAVSVWKSIVEVADKEFTFPNEGIGSAVKMITPDQSDWAKSGKIRFGKVNGDSDVSFEIHLEFNDGEKVDGTFSAKWCKRKFVCGG